LNETVGAERFLSVAALNEPRDERWDAVYSSEKQMNPCGFLGYRRDYKKSDE